MTDLLILVVLTSLALYGSKVTWQEGMAFESLKNGLDKMFSTFWRKPLYSCPACMASFWGSTVYSITMWDKWHFGTMILFIFAVCGLVWILMWQFPFDD